MTQTPSIGSPNFNNDKSAKPSRKIRNARLPADLQIKTEEIIPEFDQANPAAHPAIKSAPLQAA